MTLNMENMKTEMVVFLRNSDILSTAQRGVTTTSNTFVSTASQTLYTLPSNVVRNIRTVVSDGSFQFAYEHYTPDYKAAGTTLTFLTGRSENDSVVITYDHSAGTKEKVFPDYPQIEYLVDDVPRVGMGLIGPKTRIISIGSPNYFTDCIFRIKVYDKNLKNMDNYITTIRSAVKAAQLDFFHFQILTPTNVGPELLHDISSGTKLTGKVFEKSVDLTGRFSYEE